MQTYSSLIFVTILLLQQINKGVMSSTFGLYGQCECEQLFYESECSTHPHCQYIDNLCKTKPCNQLNSAGLCIYNKKCGWDQGVCSEFQSCLKFTKRQDCMNYNSQCIYSLVTFVCAKYDEEFTKSCSETEIHQCKQGKDGPCYVQNGSCQKINACEDFKSNDQGCLYAYDYCISNTLNKKCESRIGCENQVVSSLGICPPAPEEIGSKVYYVCQVGEKGQCEDWDVDNETLETCHNHSNGYYHWTGSACELCQKGNNEAISLMMKVIILSFLWN